MDKSQWIQIINQLSSAQMKEIMSGQNANYWIDYFSQFSPNALAELRTYWPTEFGRLYLQNSLYQARESGDYNQVQQDITDSSRNTQNQFVTPAMQQEVNNGISNQNTKAQWAQEEYMRDTSYTSAGSQLQGLGLSASGVIQTGAANSGQLSTANNSMTNIAQQQKIERFQQQMSIARSIIGLTGSLASSGIYGHAIGAARSAAAVTAAATAHSARNAIMSKSWSGKGNGPLLSGKLLDEWNKLPGAY